MSWFRDRKIYRLERRLSQLLKEDRVQRDVVETTEAMMDDVYNRALLIAKTRMELLKLTGTWELRKVPRNGDRT